VTSGSLDGARERLDRAGLGVEVIERHSPHMPPGLVVEQQPEPGRQVSLPPGYRVTVTVTSTTPDTVTVPDVLGADVADAAEQVRAAGLVPRITHACPGGSPTCTGAVERAGQVWEHVPAAGVTAEGGDDVLLQAFPSPS
jgi:serine/threonine-protein kinase